MRVTTPRLLRIKPLRPEEIPRAAHVIAKAARIAETSPDVAPPSVATQLQAKQHVYGKAWPANLRIEEHVSGRELFWKVSMSARGGDRESSN